MTFFSVIIPLYNKENFIENTLKSVLNQSFANFEVLLINDGSTDKSEEKALQFKDSRIHYFSRKNEGVSSARNFGLEKAQSPYIAFIDADDYWHPHFLQEMFQNINRFPELKVFTAAIELETSKKIIPAAYSIPRTSDCEIVNFFKASSGQCVIWTSCAVFDKSVFEETGNFDLEIKSGQDMDLWIRIGLIYPVLFSWKILARYINDDNSLSKSEAVTAGGMKFTKFTAIEKTNPDAKKFIDLNRFTLAIKSKLSGDYALYKNYCDNIDLNQLSLKKRIILALPTFALKPLINLKTILANRGLGRSVFK